MTKATFVCDHCAARVDLLADTCPSCGKVFDAVRCPRCGHEGRPRAFADGCPKCRFLATPPRPVAPERRRRSTFAPAMAVLGVLLVLATALAWALRAG